jgi:hypothetical protein
MGVINQLRELRDFGGKPRTVGLDDATIERLAAHSSISIRTTRSIPTCRRRHADRGSSP